MSFEGVPEAELHRNRKARAGRFITPGAEKTSQCLLPREMIKEIAEKVQSVGEQLAHDRGWSLSPDGNNFAELILGKFSQPNQVARTGKTWAEIVWEKRQKGEIRVVYEKDGVPFMAGFPYRNKLVVLDLNFGSLAELRSGGTADFVCTYIRKLGFPQGNFRIDTSSERVDGDYYRAETKEVPHPAWRQFSLKQSFTVFTVSRLRPETPNTDGFLITYEPSFLRAVMPKINVSKILKANSINIPILS